MNFPAPPSFHDPLLHPSPSTPSSGQVGLRQQQQQLPPPAPREQQGFPSQIIYLNQPLQHQHQQPPPQLVLMNGINGAGNMPGAVVGLPTQVAQQAELNYIYGMVEELSRQLAENKRALEDVVAGVGRVRHRARANSLSNEELINAGAEDINSQEPNMDNLISLLSEALEKAKFSRDANAALLSQYAQVVSTMLKQFHEYKAKHVSDVAAWHSSYRAQLAEARDENSRLREQIWDMQEHAGHANELAREFRTRHDDDAARREAQIENKALRQELRFWKRLAMPELAEDDSYWSDDDDLIDPVEKIRLHELERNAEQRAAAAAAASDGDSGGEEGDAPPPDALEQQEQQQQQQQRNQPATQGMMGGVPMQREDSGTMGIPTPPPRPLSANSTGSSGQ